jgi:hypothetical protein
LHSKANRSFWAQTTTAFISLSPGFVRLLVWSWFGQVLNVTDLTKPGSEQDQTKSKPKAALLSFLLKPFIPALFLMQINIFEAYIML